MAQLTNNGLPTQGHPPLSGSILENYHRARAQEQVIKDLELDISNITLQYGQALADAAVKQQATNHELKRWRAFGLKEISELEIYQKEISDLQISSTARENELVKTREAVTEAEKQRQSAEERAKELAVLVDRAEDVKQSADALHLAVVEYKILSERQDVVIENLREQRLTRRNLVFALRSKLEQAEDLVAELREGKEQAEQQYAVKLSEATAEVDLKLQELQVSRTLIEQLRQDNDILRESLEAAEKTVVTSTSEKDRLLTRLTLANTTINALNHDLRDASGSAEKHQNEIRRLRTGLDDKISQLLKSESSTQKLREQLEQCVEENVEVHALHRKCNAELMSTREQCSMLQRELEDARVALREATASIDSMRADATARHEGLFLAIKQYIDPIANHTPHAVKSQSRAQDRSPRNDQILKPTLELGTMLLAAQLPSPVTPSTEGACGRGNIADRVDANTAGTFKPQHAKASNSTQDPRLSGRHSGPHASPSTNLQASKRHADSQDNRNTKRGRFGA